VGSRGQQIMKLEVDLYGLIPIEIVSLHSLEVVAESLQVFGTSLFGGQFNYGSLKDHTYLEELGQ
jgi:hypothetical protein